MAAFLSRGTENPAILTDGGGLTRGHAAGLDIPAAGGQNQRRSGQKVTKQSFSHGTPPQIPRSCRFFAENSSSVIAPLSSSALYRWISATGSAGSADGTA